MNVNKILQNVTTMLQLNDLNLVLRGQALANVETQKEIDLLVECVNFVNNLIATDYIKLYDSFSYDNFIIGDVVSFSTITDKTIYSIVSVKDSFGEKLPFNITSSGVELMSTGTNIIKFTYFPTELLITDNITDYKTKLNERIFAYGVASEYLFIKGDIDDASMWDTRFKRSLLNVIRTQKEIKIPAQKLI